MKFSGILNAVVLTAAVAASSAVAQAGTTVQTVRANLAATATDGTENGFFRLADVERNGVSFQGVLVYVRGLPTPAPTGETVEIILSNDTQQADLGAMTLSRDGSRGWFRFDTRKGPLPEGVTDLSPFSGGTIHVSIAGADVATAAIPAFVAPEGPAPGGTGPSNSIAFGYGVTVLGDATAMGKGPVARVAGFAGNGFGGVVQEIGVGGFGLDRGATYTVVLTGATEDTLGTFTVSQWFGLGGFVLSTRRGDTIPGGSVSALAGRGVEIRDATGTAVLTGVFPSLN